WRATRRKFHHRDNYLFNAIVRRANLDETPPVVTFLLARACRHLDRRGQECGVTLLIDRKDPVLCLDVSPRQSRIRRRSRIQQFLDRLRNDIGAGRRNPLAEILPRLGWSLRDVEERYYCFLFLEEFDRCRARGLCIFILRRIRPKRNNDAATLPRNLLL